MPLLPVYDWLGLDFSTRRKKIINVVALSLIGFVLVDYFLIHEFIWHNEPDTGYWLAKPVWVGVPMIVGTWYFVNRRDFTVWQSSVIAAVVGVIYLQAYYTFVPVPIEDGPSIQVGFVGNFTEGLVVHSGGIVLAVAAVALLYGFIKR